jgi:hypothetical protein
VTVGPMKRLELEVQATTPAASEPELVQATPG